MRVKFIIAPTKHPDYINIGMYENLCREFQSHDKVDIVDLSPDIVHIFGIWNRKYASYAEHYRRIGVPVIFTSVNGMLSIILKSGRITNNISTRIAIRKICRIGAVVHVCGKMEERIISGLTKNVTIKTIANASFTSLISLKDMCDSFYNLYTTEIDSNEIRIRERIQKKIHDANIDDTVIADICSRLLYIRQRFKMQNIPLFCLEETARVMTESDYDENVMRQALKIMKLQKFSAYTMTILKRRANLTEGFMPLACSNGRTVAKLENVII